MSKKRVDQVVSPNLKEEAKKKKLFEHEFGLSFDGPKRGFKIMPEGMLMCEEIFSLLFERLDEEMMKKRVDAEYKGYSVKNCI